MTTDYIRVEHVTKRFGSFRAVDDADFGIRQGEFFSLLGPSGCGKTTLLRMIAGFEFPTEGEIYIDGQPVTGVPANKRPTNMVFQSYAISAPQCVRQHRLRPAQAAAAQGGTRQARAGCSRDDQAVGLRGPQV